MKRLMRSPGLAAAVGLALVAIACTDRADPTGAASKQPTDFRVPRGELVSLMAITCSADVQSGTVRCARARTGGGASTALIVGGQGTYINVATSSGNYNAAAELFTFNATVRNLIPQPLGTTDGTTLDPAGVRVFFTADPVATSGTGQVTVIPDGMDSYTGSAQPYYQYNSVLDQYEVSAPKTWSFSMPGTVTGFTFTAYVAAAVQYPNGWIEVSPSPYPLHPGSSIQIQTRVRNNVGDLVPYDTVSFATADSTLATVNPATGIATGVRAGTVGITVTNNSGTRVGVATMNVTGTTRIWEGDVSSDWHTRGNWRHHVIPVPADSVLIPDSAFVVNSPVLAANVQVTDVRVEPSRSISLNSFDLTATGNVFTSGTGNINNTTGRLVLAGTAKNVSGTLPRLRVTGTYSLTANVTARAPVEVSAGRLTVAGFRLQASSF